MNPTFDIFKYSIINKADKSIDIHVDGDIVDAPTQEMLKHWFGDESSTSFKSLRNQIEKADPKTINLFVNSTGGHVGDAMAIHDYLSNLESKGVVVNRNGIGIVASAATYIVMGNNSSLTKNSHFLIHNAASFAYGDINQMEIQVKNVRKFNDSIVSFYSDITGKDKKTISNWMNEETWFTAQEAKDNGFVSNVTGEATFTNKIEEGKWNFINKDILHIYNSFTNKNPIDMDVKKITDAIETGFVNMLDKLGLSNKKDDTVVQESFKEFANSIVNAITGVGVGILKEDIEAIIVDRVKDFATKNDLATLATTESVTTATKDVVTKDTLKNSLDTYKNDLLAEVSKSLGKQSGAPDGNEDGGTGTGNKKKTRFSNASSRGLIVQN